MKSFCVILMFLPLLVVAQDCCMPLQLETLQGVYFGYTLRTEPGFEPLTVNGLTRLIYDYENQKQLTQYISLAVPGEEDRVSILGDYALDGTSTTRFYNTFTDGSCFYEDFEGVLMIPPCFDLIWPALADYTFGLNIQARTYGDDVLNNYVVVQLPECNPLLNIATRRNQPEEGVYRWETSAIINMTVGISDPSVLESPTDCQPTTNPTGVLPRGFHYQKLKTDEIKPLN